MVVVDIDGNVIEGKMKPSVDTGQAIIEAAAGGLAALVKAHGVFTMGRSATEATSIATYPEEAAITPQLAMLRGPIEELRQKEIDRCCAWYRQNYGQSGGKNLNS